MPQPEAWPQDNFHRDPFNKTTTKDKVRQQKTTFEATQESWKSVNLLNTK